MSTTQYRVHLTSEERSKLHRIVRQAMATVFTARRARILLAADHRSGHVVPTDAQIAAEVGVSPRTVARVRARWAEAGVEATLAPRARRTRGRSRYDLAAHARITQLALSDPPPGQTRWSLRMLADEIVTLEIVPHICPESVRQVLKKTVSAHG